MALRCSSMAAKDIISKIIRGAFRDDLGLWRPNKVHDQFEAAGIPLDRGAPVRGTDAGQAIVERHYQLGGAVERGDPPLQVECENPVGDGVGDYSLLFLIFARQEPPRFKVTPRAIYRFPGRGQAG